MPLDLDPTMSFEDYEKSLKENPLTESQIQQEKEEELGFWGTLGDMGRGVGRGVVSAVENTLEVGNIIPGIDYDIYETDDFIDPTESMAGSITEGLTQFITGFVPAVGLVGKVGQVAKLGNVSSKIAKRVYEADKAKRKLTALAIARGAEVGKYSAAGAVGEFFAFDGHEERLSRLLNDIPALENPFLEWMAGDDSDTELEGRMKNVIEGLGLGAVVDGLMISFKAFRAGARYEGPLGKPRDAEVQRKVDQYVQELAEKEAKDVAVEGTTKGADEALDEVDEVIEEVDEVVEEATEASVGVLSEKEFREQYSQHIDIRSRKTGKGAEVAAKVSSEGFASGFGMNTLPVSMGTPPMNVVDEKWMPRKGDTVYLVPNDAIDLTHGSGKIKAGWKPKKGEIVTVEYDNQSMYELYQRNIPTEATTKATDEVVEEVDEVIDYDTLTEAELKEIQKNNTLNYSTLSENEKVVNTLRAHAHASVALRTQAEETVPMAKQLEESEQLIEDLEDVGLISGRNPSRVKDTAAMAAEEAKKVRKASYFRHFVKDELQRFGKDVYDLTLKFTSSAVTLDKAAAVRYLMAKGNLEELLVAYKNLSGEFGRALQLHKATPSKTIEKLKPGTIDEILKDPKSIDDILNAHGGFEAVQKEAEKFVKAYEANPDSIGKPLKLIGKKGGWGASTIEYWMNSILSGPKTQIVNGLSGLLVSLMAPIELASGKALTGQFRAAGRDLKRYVYLAENSMESLRAAGSAIWNNRAILDEVTTSTGDRAYGESAITNTLINSRLLNSTLGVETTRFMAKVLGGTVTLPSRLLMGGDEFFKQLNYRSAMKAGLVEQALKDGMTSPPQIAEFVHKEFNRIVDDGQYYNRKKVFSQASSYSEEELIEQLKRQNNKVLKELGDISTDRMEYLKAKNAYVNWEMNKRSPLAEKARKHARAVTFTEELADDRGTFIKLSRTVQGIPNAVPAMRLVLPFTRTPSNIIQHVFERTPVNLLSVSQQNTWYGLRKDVFNPDNPEVRAEALGRIFTGSTLLTVGYFLGINGQITGGGPTDPAKRRVLEDTGWQPYAVKVGDSYFSYRRADPYSSLFGIMADIVDIYQHGDETTRDETEALGMALLVSLANNVNNKTYLTGVTKFANALSRPENFVGSMFRSTAAGFIPNIIGQSVHSTDDEIKDLRNLSDTLKARIPFFSEDAPPRRNMFGEALTYPRAGIPVVDSLNPFDYSSTSSDVLKQELAQIGHGFSAPRSLKNGVELREYKNTSGQSAYDRWLELHGKVKINGKTLRQTITQLMKSRDYKKLPYQSIEGLDNSPRVRAINRILSKYRAKAFSQMLREFPDVRQRDEMNLLIKEARRTGKSYEELLAIANQ